MKTELDSQLLVPLNVCVRYGGRPSEERDFAGGHFGIKSGVRVNQRADQLCCGTRFLLSHWEKMDVEAPSHMYSHTLNLPIHLTMWGNQSKDI